MTSPGYILPTSSVSLPRKLTLTQFIQTVFVGVSGLPGTLVRPNWQVEPPKQPDLAVNWMAIGIDEASPDANAYLSVDDSGNIFSERQEVLEVGCSIYGPEALETYGLIRDGFQIPTNRDALFRANMAFVEISPARHIPDLVFERFINRVTTSVFLRRDIQRTYGVPTILSASGTIHTVFGNEEYLLDFAVSQ